MKSKWVWGDYSKESWSRPLHVLTFGISLTHDDLAGWTFHLAFGHKYLAFIQRYTKGVFNY